MRRIFASRSGAFWLVVIGLLLTTVFVSTILNILVNENAPTTSVQESTVEAGDCKVFADYSSRDSLNASTFGSNDIALESTSIRTL